MFAKDEVIGIYRIMRAGPVSLRYAFDDDPRKSWRCRNYMMLEWMEEKGYEFRKRCRGRDVAK